MIPEKKTVNNCIKNNCSRCGNCCGAIPLPITKKEAQDIVDYVIENNIKRNNREWVQQVHDGVTEGLTINLRCCFYDSEKKECSIYEVRPLCCQVYKCNQTEKHINRNKEKNHKRAYFNYDSGKKMRNITNFDLLFFGDSLPLQFEIMNYGIPYKEFMTMFEKYGCKQTYNIMNNDRTTD